MRICVIGGGPAGAVVAYRLCRLGHDVLLIDGRNTPKPHATESFPPSLEALLDSLGLLHCLEAATFRRQERSLVSWDADSAPSTEHTPRRLVDRIRFDEALRKAALLAGVKYFPHARARAASRSVAGGWSIPLQTREGPLLLTADFLIDARGRRRADGTDGRSNPVRTAAITGILNSKHSRWSEPRVEAGQDEWYWGSPLADGQYAVTVFLDLERIVGLRMNGRANLYMDLLRGARLFRGVSRNDLVGPVMTCDATSRISTSLVEDDLIRTGEAAFSIDPISSQGVQAAVRSAAQGAATVHTILTRPADRDAAIEFYTDRQQKAAMLGRLNAARHFGFATSGTSPFWRRRSTIPSLPVNRPVKVNNPMLANTRLHISPDTRIVQVPLLSEEIITRAAAVIHPALDGPSAYMNGIAIVPLIDMIEAGSTGDQILKRWSQVISPPAAHRILDGCMH